MKQLKEITTNKGVSIPFAWKDETPGGKNLGWAEFGITIQFNEDAKVNGYFVYALQQHKIKSYLHYMSGDIDFTIGSYDNLSEPRVWMIHKSIQPEGTCFHIYVPKNGKWLNADYHGVNFGLKPLYEVIEL